MCDNDFSTLFIKNIDQCIINYDNIIVMGDLNFDMLNDKKMSSFKRFMWCPWFFTISLKTNMFYEKLYPIIGGCGFNKSEK
jgi:hypothetical protein